MPPEPHERPCRVLAHEGLGIVERTGEGVDIARIADVAEHHRRVALEPPQLRALHRRALERGAELCLRHPEQFPRERPRILLGDRLAP
jgi:hypothetical protein